MKERMLIFQKIFRWCGSLWTASILLSLLAVLCGWATFIELDFGTPAASQLIYRNSLFRFLLLLLSLNIVSSILARFPWKRTLIPFLCAHIGVLILLAGCWITFRYAREAKMTIAEGTSLSTAVFPNDRELAAERVDFSDMNLNPEKMTFPFWGGPFNLSDRTPNGWKKNVIDPAEEGMPPCSGFFSSLSRLAFDIHYHLAGTLLRYCRRPAILSPAEQSDKRIHFEILDYLVHGDFEPVPPARLSLNSIGSGEKESATFDFSNYSHEKECVSSQRGIRRWFSDGTCVIFYLTGSCREADSLYSLTPDQNSDQSENTPFFELSLACAGKITRLSYSDLEKFIPNYSDHRKDNEQNSSADIDLGGGWSVVKIEIVPTMVPGIETIQGWTARIGVQHKKSGTTDQLQLSSDWKERDIQGENSGITGALFGVLPDQMKTPLLGRKFDTRLTSPRIELFQSPDGILRYRCRDKENKYSAGETVIPQDNSPISISLSESRQLEICNFFPHDEFGVRLIPTSFRKEMANEFYGKIRLRAKMKSQSGKETTETFWIRAIPTGMSGLDESVFSRTLFDADGVRYNLKLQNCTLNPGFSIFVKNFKPVYEPGSSIPSSFSSLVDYQPEQVNNGKGRCTAGKENITIRMNHPGIFDSPSLHTRFWVYQDSFRGPFNPGNPIFDQTAGGHLLPGETVPREHIYQTVLSINADPGRGLKYLGSFLIVLGTALLFLRKRIIPSKFVESAENQTNNTERKVEQSPVLRQSFLRAFFSRIIHCHPSIGKTTPFLAILSALIFACYGFGTVPSDTPSPNSSHLDWTNWRLLPVFDSGRVMPLNSYAVMTVKEICGTDHPVIAVPSELLVKLELGTAVSVLPLESFLEGKKVSDAQREQLEHAYSELKRQKELSQKNAAKRIRTLIPDGKRKFTAHEIVFSWITEPEVWEFIPFIADPNRTVRYLINKENSEAALHFLSPAELRGTQEYARRIDALTNGEAKNFSDWNTAVSEGKIDRACAMVEGRLSRFDTLVFRPTREKMTGAESILHEILFKPRGGDQSDSQTLLEELNTAFGELKHKKRLFTKGNSESPINDPNFYPLQSEQITGPGGKKFEIMTLIRDIHRIAADWETDEYFENTQNLLDVANRLDDSAAKMNTWRNALYQDDTISAESRVTVLNACRLLNEVSEKIQTAVLSAAVGELQTVSSVSDKKRIIRLPDGKGYQATPSAVFSIHSGGCLSILPNRSVRNDEEKENSTYVWLPLQSILWNSPSFRHRYILPDSQNENGEEPEVKLEKHGNFSFVEMLKDKIEMENSETDILARSFCEAADAYQNISPDRKIRFENAISNFSSELRKLGESVSLPKSASYPAYGALTAEYNYFRLDPFCGLWFFSLLAFLFLVFSFFGSDKVEKIFFVFGVIFLLFAEIITAIGGGFRAYITGWAPVTNMFETVVLLAFLVLAVTIYWVFQPYIGTSVAWSWNCTRWYDEKQHKCHSIRVLTRTILTFLTFCATLWICYHEQSAGKGIWLAFWESFCSQGVLDRVAVLGTIGLATWFIPRFLMTMLFLPLAPRQNCSEREYAFQIVWKRRIFTLVGALVAFSIGLLAYYNTSEFNPNIRPITAVLRSNFWLTVHVLAIMFSYALGTLAWILSLVLISSSIFGKCSDGNEPDLCRRYGANVYTLLRFATLFLTLGIILGARWADFSWGRFWSWDPKEVWALVTLLIYLTVLHLHKKRKQILSLTFGGLLGGLSILMTWYGLSFVFGGGGRHSYAAGESGKTAVLCILFAANIIYGILAWLVWHIRKSKMRS